MKEELDMINANIDNLTSLWQTTCETFDSYSIESGFEYCEINDSQWPNRLWFNQDLDQSVIDRAKVKLVALKSDITVPIWNINNDQEHKILENNGFNLKFEQIGMFLKLKTYFEMENDISIRPVSNNAEAEEWAELFTKSFGYIISKETVAKTFNKIKYYIAYHKKQAVGTAMTHKTNNVFGVHSVGIPPEMRRRGYAKQIMKVLLNLAVKGGNEYMMLQASDMGKNMYLKLGFKEQFLIKNYNLTT